MVLHSHDHTCSCVSAAKVGWPSDLAVCVLYNAVAYLVAITFSSTSKTVNLRTGINCDAAENANVPSPNMVYYPWPPRTRLLEQIENTSSGTA